MMTKTEIQAAVTLLEQRLEAMRCEVAGMREREQIRREQCGPQKPEDYETHARHAGLWSISETQCKSARVLTNAATTKKE